MTERLLEKESSSKATMASVDRLDHPRSCVSGEWHNWPSMTDYRAEQLGDLFVERATWRSDAPTRRLWEQMMLAPGHIWFRFWMLNSDYVIEKYFDAAGRTLGVFVPICMPIVRGEECLHAHSLLLALWLAPDGRIGVLNESLFDDAVLGGLLDPSQSAYAERRIREATMEISERRFPPALIRNFALQVPEPDHDRDS